ncbi:MAG: mechanosensitive ion channel family protein [Candidatus Omnitrophica bacterium]|nr:mechanosensitive ion channel family protein [Candidatus Omnitrophota bacterium]
MNIELSKILQLQCLGNSVQSYLISVFSLIGILIFLYFIKVVLLNKIKALAERTSSDFDDFLVGLISQIRWHLYFIVAIYFGTRNLVLNPALDRILAILLVVFVSFRAVRILQSCIGYGMEKWLGKTPENALDAKASAQFLGVLINGALWVAAVLFIMSNLGINVTSFIAGLGIGGIAVALAAQAILGDAFSAISIHVDKPFRVGDFIIVDDLLGVVEHVGLKTTRVQSLHGEGLVFPNSDLTSSRIRNFKRMRERRIAFSVGATYQTTLEQLKKIPPMAAEILEGIEEAHLDRCHFKEFGNFSLNFEIVYYVHSPDYNVYMNVQQKINWALKEGFEREGIEFAYPTQTLFLEKTAA